MALSKNNLGFRAVATVAVASLGFGLSELSGVTDVSDGVQPILNEGSQTGTEGLVEALGLETVRMESDLVQGVVKDLLASDKEAKGLCGGYFFGSDGRDALKEFEFKVLAAQDDLDLSYDKYGVEIAEPTRQECRNYGEGVVYKSTLAFEHGGFFDPTHCEITETFTGNLSEVSTVALECQSRFGALDSYFLVLSQPEARGGFALTD